MTRRCERPTGDDGTSLMELIIGMALMAIFMAMFTGAVLMMTSTANKVQAVTVSSGAVNQAFLQLDKTVRYASAISTPRQATSGTGDWYVELSSPNTSGVSTCTQLRVDVSSKQLQKRTWTMSADTTPIASAASAWQPLASSITAPTIPFVLGTNTTSLYQQLTIELTSTTAGSAQSPSAVSVMFTALNSTPTPPSSICNQKDWP